MSVGPAAGGAWTGWADERPRPHSALIRLGLVLAVSLILVVLVVLVFQPAAPTAACPAPPAPCNVPPVPPGTVPTGPTTGQGGGTAELVVGSAWSSSEFGFSLHYDPADWVLKEDQKDLLELISPSDASGSEREDWVIVEGVPASNDTPQQLIQERLASLETSVPDLAVDPSSYYQVNGAEIGNVPGIAEVYVGTLDDTDGTPLAPVRYSIVAASNGQVTVAVTVRTLDPDEIADHGPPAITWHMLSRQLADRLLEDFRWPPAR